jgi:hypothetical protein
MGPEDLTPDELTARLIADAEQQLRLPQAWPRLNAALERERFTGPMHAAHYAGERAAAIARTTAEREGLDADEVYARGYRAFWAGYYIDLADESSARAAAWREEMRQHGDPDVDTR